jgi:hypothetical protein
MIRPPEASVPEPTLRAMLPDPRFIHDRLPEDLKDEFIDAYSEALDTTRERLSYQPLRELLVAWNKRLILSSNPGAEESLAALAEATQGGNGPDPTVSRPFEEIRRG